MAGNLELCDIFVIMRRSLVRILSRKTYVWSKRKDAVIELYLNRLQGGISSLDYKVWYSYLTKSERDLTCLLENDNIIIFERLAKDQQFCLEKRGLP